MDFRTFVAELDAAGELLKVHSEVDPEYELGALLKQAEARRKAIRFERVKGSPFPAVGGVMSNPERHARSIGRAPQQMAAPGAWAAAIATARANPLPAVQANSGPAAEVVLQGNDVDLGRLPCPFVFPGDTHKFITAGLGIVLDPDTGIQNVGFYRAPLVDAQHISISGGVSSRLKQIYQAAARQNSKLSIAFIIGAPPALLLTAGCRINRDEADLDIAGALQGTPLELMRCQTSDLLVPAQAEFVIEAEVELGNMLDHTMGEFPDSYGVTRSPVARVTAISHRGDAVYHTILGGMNREHNALGSYIFAGLREQLLEQLKLDFPGLLDVEVALVPRRMGGRCQICVALDKQNNAEPQQIIDAIYASTFDTFPLELIIQRIVVVDGDVAIRSSADVEWAIAMRADARDKIRVIEAPARGGGTTVRLAIDATLELDRRQAGERPRIPDIGKYPLDKYL
jgi:2,5-furandicarboxylate decarboxylase 1